MEELLEKHLKSKNLFKKQPLWAIKSSGFKERGVYANRDVECNEIIFRDGPLLSGPRLSDVSDSFCVICYKQENSRLCSNNCGLQLCSERCENSKGHKAECRLIKGWGANKDGENIRRCLAPIRGLLLDKVSTSLLGHLKSHESPTVEISIIKEKLKIELTNEEESTLRLICSVLDTNAFEVIAGTNDKTISLRGIYPLASLMNHSCIPNTTHYFDSNQNIIVIANTFIPKGHEILHCYTPLFWGTCLRRPYLLRTKKFVCSCRRCLDPTENGTYLGALRCASCKSFVLPIYIQKLNIVWKCITCNQIMEKEKACGVLAILGNCIKNLEEATPEEILKFLKGPALNQVPICNQIFVQIKFKLVWKLGHKPGYTWGELSDELLDVKEAICHELLELINKLRGGKSKMRGLFLYELYSCLREKRRRLQESNITIKEQMEDITALFEESCDILSNDVHAPLEIKSHNQKNRSMDRQNTEISLAG